MTLPLIHALTLLHGGRRRHLAEILNNFNDNLWDELMGLLETSDSIQYAESLMLIHLERAIHELEQFPSSMAKSLLLKVVENVHSRHL